MNLKTLQFPNIGVITAVFTDEELAPLKEEILEIQNNFNLAKKHNKKLVGHIKKEFELIKSKEHIEKILEP
jgi:cell division protein ZapA (FtsZ GTPase activity inhibitor)